MRHLCARVLRKLANIIDIHSGRYIDISDEYVRWLCYANAGMLNPGNLYCFDYAIQNLPSEAPIIEIGSFCGLSTNLLTYYKQRHSAYNPLITCDKWEFETAQIDSMVGESSISHPEYRTFVKETYIRNIRMFSRHDLPYTVEMLSDDFFAAWRKSEEVADVLGRTVQLGGPISFCYIDGNHSYDFVKRDFENCNESLESGGFILFDDSEDGSGREVCLVVAEVKASEKYDVVIKNPNYLFVKR